MLLRGAPRPLVVRSRDRFYTELDLGLDTVQAAVFSADGQHLYVSTPLNGLLDFPTRSFDDGAAGHAVPAAHRRPLRVQAGLLSMEPGGGALLFRDAAGQQLWQVR